MADEATETEVSAVTLDASIDAAFDKVFGGDEPEAPEAPSEEPSGPARGPDGKFVAKEPAGDAEPVVQAEVAPPAEPEAPVAAVEPPSRFSADAKQFWGTTPPAVQAEVNRAFAELEKGIGEYRAKWEPVRQFAEMAERQGQTLADAMQRYVGIEQELAQNPVQGLDRICQNLGFSLRDVAAHVLGQPAPERDVQVSQMQQQMREMQGKLQHYEAQERRQQEERYSSTLETVHKFAAEHPRYGELEGTIAAVLKSGLASDLPSAYEIADRLKPGPAATAAPPAPAATTPPPAQPKKAGISIDGAPGSNPTQRPKSKSADEAIDRAFDRVGL